MVERFSGRAKLARVGKISNCRRIPCYGDTVQPWRFPPYGHESDNAQQAMSLAADAEKESQSLQRDADSHCSEFGEGDEVAQEARRRAVSAKMKADDLRKMADAATREVESKRALLQKRSWDPAIPEF